MMPCHPARARKLLKSGRARVARLAPFVVRVVDRSDFKTQPILAKIDPGSKATGIALVRADNQNANHSLLFAAEIEHRGAPIRKKMHQRSNYRRRRRSANLRYRAPRLNNRTRKEVWLPPSLRSRVDNVVSWLERLRRWAPVSAIWIEKVRFDAQKLQNPEISGIAYQQGTLAGYEIREYLLEKWGRKCVYCDAADIPLQIEHIEPRAKGGSNRISNLTLACGCCNQKKGSLNVSDFLSDRPEILRRILRAAKTPLRDAAAVNATRNRLFAEASDFGIPVSGFSGGMTKFNRSRLGVPKTHALDAACVGDFGRLGSWENMPVLKIKAQGRGSYQRTRITRFGFPRGHLMRGKTVKGFRTGDIVKAVVPKGTKAGTHIGRAAVRASGSFNIQTPMGAVQGVSHKHCRMLQRADGYNYNIQSQCDSSPTK